MRYAYYAMILVIGAVAAYDNSMTWIYSETIVELEQNPVGSWLLEQGGVSLFITVKAAATVLLAGVLFGLTRTKYRWLVAGAFTFQLVMFAYLNLFSMERGHLVINSLFRGDGECTHPITTWIEFMKGFYL